MLAKFTLYDCLITPPMNVHEFEFIFNRGHAFFSMTLSFFWWFLMSETFHFDTFYMYYTEIWSQLFPRPKSFSHKCDRIEWQLPLRHRNMLHIHRTNNEHWRSSLNSFNWELYNRMHFTSRISSISSWEAFYQLTNVKTVTLLFEWHGICIKLEWAKHLVLWHFFLFCLYRFHQFRCSFVAQYSFTVVVMYRKPTWRC